MFKFKNILFYGIVLAMSSQVKGTLMAISIIGIVSNTQAAVNCLKRQNLNLKNTRDCCNIPEPNWESFFNECFNLMSPFERPPSPCALECIFNTTNILQNGELNSENVEVLLSRLFSDETFIVAFAQGIKKCAPIIKAKIAELRTNGHSLGFKSAVAAQTCSPLALIHVMCAHKSVFINCPPSAWTASTMCANSREYFIKCDRTPGGWGGTSTVPHNNKKKNSK